VTATGEAALDVTRLRARFPALTRRVGDEAAVYLDGPGGSQVPDTVVRAVAEYLESHNANTDGPFVTSVATDDLLEEARLAAADFLGSEPDEIVFGANTTTINFLLAHALARTLQPGDEVIVTELDHEANVSPWLLIAADRGLTVKTAPLNTDDGTLDLAALEELITPRTRVVACTMASNAIGSITDVARVANTVHATGSLLWLDGVHLAPHRRLDRVGLGADVLLTSAYKYFGPHIGVAAVRKDLAASLPADRVRPADETPVGHHFETGTLCHEAIAGFLAAVVYLESLAVEGSNRSARLDSAFRCIAAHESELTRHTLRRLSDLPGCNVYGISEPDRLHERTPTFCLNLDGWTPHALSAKLGERGIFTYHGNYYALGATTALGLEPGGAVRAGYLHYTTMEEAERFCAAVAGLADRRPFIR
jgi:cysteine desulfurase family protein (TIGR01976 family)